MELWYPKAKVKRYRLSGGSMVGGPPRLVLHTTETSRVPSYGEITGRNSAPHFTIDRDGTVYQHQPINYAARSLRNLKGGVQTNRQGSACVQIERVGYAREGSNFPEGQLLALQDLVRWVMRQTGIKASWRNIDRGSRCYGYKSDCRMRPDEWQSFSGFCGHGEVPENTHWDPGNMDFSLLNVNEGGSDTMLPMMLGDGYRSRPEKKEDVRLLQLHLNKLGHGLVVDGAYGPATKAAVASSLGGDGTRVEAEEWMSLMEKTAVVSEELLRRGDTVKLR